MNYFSLKTAAARYNQGRPDFHFNTIQHIKAFLGLKGKLNRALDVACGTGLSTKALLEIAIEVYGTDISEEMLKLAVCPDKISYSVAPAEKLPFEENQFDLITVSSGVHWFDIDAFLKEASRILKSRSWLVLYENHFIAEMTGSESFAKWFRESYLKKYPSPPRNNDYSWTNENLNSKGFNFVTEEKFKNEIVFNKNQLIAYFTTQSNIIAAIESGQTTYAEAEEWLSKELSSSFYHDQTTRIIHYGNWIKSIQRAD